ncbi:MAG: hypothetical protein U0872_09990 [Planctomycetaceae bacterium]
MNESSEAAHVVSDAVDTLANAPESISNFFILAERLVYGTGYTAAFCCVFPLALIYEAIPKQNRLVQGMQDGACEALARARQTWS